MGSWALKRAKNEFLRVSLPVEVKDMGVSKIGEKFKCEICGNEVEVTKVGGGELYCCGEEMSLMG